MDVLTPLGFKNVNLLKPGDEIFGADGSVQHVVEIEPRSNVPILKIKSTDDCCAFISDTQTLNVRVCGGNGRFAGFRNFSVATMLNKGITRNPPSVAAGGRKPKPRYELPIAANINYPKRHYDVHPYILGVLIGDGSLHKTNVACFSTPDRDVEIALKVSSLLPNDYYLKKDTAPTCPRYIIALKEKSNRGQGYIRKIINIGLNVLSRDKFIPKEYLLGDKEQRLELLRGLMDTDGTAKNNKVSFSTKSFRLVLDVVHLVRSLGGICHWSNYNRGERGIDYSVRIRIQDCPFSLHRKAVEWRQPTMKHRLLWSVENTGELSDIPHLVVSNQDQLFITNNFLIIHT